MSSEKRARRLFGHRASVVMACASCALYAAGSLAAANDHPEPYEPQQAVYRPELLIVGGSSSGTAAALTAGRLGVKTVWTLRAPRDLGGLSTNAINPDSDLAIRYIGGLALEYDVVARYTTGFNVGGHHNGEGYFAPFHVFFRYTRQQVDRLPTITILANLYPTGVEKDPATQRVRSVAFAHRVKPDCRVLVEPRITIDAEIEGDVAHLAGVTMTLRREGRAPSNDPTRNEESYAGRIFTPAKAIHSLLISGGRLLPGSTHEADARPATMAWNGSVSLQDYAEGTPESPWVLKTPPTGYDPAEFDWWKTGIYGVTLGNGHRRWNIDQYLSTVEGWRLPDGRHVLESMDIRDREANEKAHLAHVLRGLWHLQHAKKQYRFGLSEHDFREGLPAKYWLSDFGTATNAGDAPLPGLIYMREGRRMVNDHVFGGKLIEDDGSGRFVQKTYWHPRAVYYNAMLIDIHGVHLERAPGSGPEGMQLLRLAGHHHFGAPSIPFDVLVPRPGEATGLLVASAGAYTHQAYAAFPRMETGRIAQGHACAVAAFHALGGNVPVHDVDVRKVQITNLLLHGQSLVYFDDTIPGTYWHLVDQMLGARRVPERNDQGVFQREDRVSVAEMRTYLQRLLRDYHEHPLPEDRLAAAVAELGDAPDVPVTRAKALSALSLGAGVDSGVGAGRLDGQRRAAVVGETPQAPGPFADVPSGTPLARLLDRWGQNRWIALDPRHRFRPDDPIPFSEFKLHAYHAMFGQVAPDTVRPVDYREWLVHDTFNRPDQPVRQLASGQKARGTGEWMVEAGNLRPKRPGQTVYLLADAGRADVDVAVDVFLEQTRNPAAAGIVFRAADEENMERFLVQADGPAVNLRFDARAGGRTTWEARQAHATMRRGFTLRVVARGSEVRYFLDGQPVQRQQRTPRAGATWVGLLAGGGEASRFDNLEVRTVE